MPTQNIYDLVDTWNAGATTFTAVKMNVTDTASAAGSLLMDLQVGGSSFFRVGKNGTLTAGRYATAGFFGARFDASSGIFNLTRSSDGAVLVTLDGSGNNISAGSVFATNGNITLAGDTILTRRGTANLRLGAADAAAPVAQTLSVQSVVAGTTNTAGANLTITGSQGTGTGAGGSIVFQVAPAGGTGSSQNALANVLSIGQFGSSVDRAITLFSAGAANLSTNNNVYGTSPSTQWTTLCNGGGINFITPGAFNFVVPVGWASGVNATPDTILARDAANTLALRNGANAQTFRVYNTTDGTNSEFGTLTWASAANKFIIGTSSTGTGAIRTVQLGAGNGFISLETSSTGRVDAYVGQFTINTTAGTERLRVDANGLLTFGGTTSTFPALKRSSTTLQARLADDSAFASVQGKLTTETAYTAGAPTATGYLVLYDSNGTAYRVPAVLN